MVILLAKMTEPDVLEVSCGVSGQRLSTRFVTQVPDTTQDATFQVLWIRTIRYHFLVVVGFDDQIACTTDERAYVVGNLTYIGNKTKVTAISLNEVAHTVAAVVRYSKRGNGKITQLDGGAFLDMAYQVAIDFLLTQKLLTMPS